MLAHPKRYSGGFLVATILILAPKGNVETVRPRRGRVFGTLIGSVLLIIRVAPVNSLVVIDLFGVLFLIVAPMVRFGRYGRLSYVFMTPARAALNDTAPSQVGQLGGQRLGDNTVDGLDLGLSSPPGALRGGATRPGSGSRPRR